MTLGERIHRLRLEREQSLQDVADAVGVSKAHIWQIEKGRADNPAMALVKALADHFQVTISSLVEEDVDAEDADSDLARMFRQVKELDPGDRYVLDQMLQAFRQKKKAIG